MTNEDIRSVVREVLNDERARQAQNMDETVLRTVAMILTSFGIEEEDRRELQADMRHLRKWRQSVETVEKTGLIAAVTVIVGGILGALWLGAKVLIGK